MTRARDLPPIRTWRRTLGAVRRRLLRLAGAPPPRDKYAEETRFWRRQIPQLLSWLDGEIGEHFRTPSPSPEQVVPTPSREESAVRTWFELHQKPKYRIDLDLGEDAFEGARLLDVGCGPYPSGEAFRGAELVCLDPLLTMYADAGYPLRGYGPRTRWLCGRSEAIPLADGSIDAVISVNAIDHVDDFAASAREIGRVLAPGGRLRMHVHYHAGNPVEPQALDDRRVAEAFGWCRGLRKIAESESKASATARHGETFALWSNF